MDSDIYIVLSVNMLGDLLVIDSNDGNICM